MSTVLEPVVKEQTPARIARHRTRRAKETQELNIPSLPDETAKNIVQLFKLLADETRLQILHFLMQQNELNVGTLCQLLNQSQPAVSHHLALLRLHGLIKMRRSGKHNFYALEPAKFRDFLDLMFDASPKQVRQIQFSGRMLSYLDDNNEAQ